MSEPAETPAAPEHGRWLSSSGPPDEPESRGQSRVDAPQPSTADSRSARKSPLTAIYAGIAIVGLAAASGGVYLAWRDSGGRPAIRKCEAAVRAELKSPSTASFSGEHAKDDGLWWTVTGSVDSQNTFGAVVRNAWSCQSDKDVGLGTPLQTVVTGGLDN